MSSLDNLNTLSKATAQSSANFVNFLISEYKNERGVHAETIIGAMAALAGEFALRASEPTLPDEGWVHSETVNGILFENETKGQMTLWAAVRKGAIRRGASPDSLPDPQDVVACTAKSVGQSPFPPLSIPENYYPLEWSPNACPKYRAQIEKLAMEQGLSTTECAIALGFSVGLLIAKTSDILPPAIAATLALEIMIGVSRMAPLKAPVTA